MNSSFTLDYDNGRESLRFCREGEFWLTEPPDFSSVQVDIRDSRTSGQVGSAITAHHVRPKSILLTGCIVGRAGENRTRLLRVVAPGVLARLTYTCGGKSWYIEGTPAHTPIIDAGDVVQDFQIRFYAPYPYWKSSDETPFEVVGLAPLFSFPFNSGGSWYISLFGSSYTNNFYNTGNVPTEFELRIFARSDVRAPSLTHLGTGRSIRFERVLYKGQTLVVSTIYGRRAARLIHPDGTEESAFRWLSLQSDIAMRLEPGDNRLHYNADVNPEGARVTVLAPRGVMSGV